MSSDLQHSKRKWQWKDEQLNLNTNDTYRTFKKKKKYADFFSEVPLWSFLQLEINPSLRLNCVFSQTKNNDMKKGTESLCLQVTSNLVQPKISLSLPQMESISNAGERKEDVKSKEHVYSVCC